MIEKPYHPRKHPRHKLLNTFVTNKLGICRLFDLSSGGVSFGCSSSKDIPGRLVIDILDDDGLHLIDLPVERVWAAKNNDLNTATIYDTVVGAKFSDDLSPEQQVTLDQLLEVLSEKILQ